MKIYDEGTLEEWSRVLRSKYGNEFRLYSTPEETIGRWRDHLSHRLGTKFEVKKDIEETLHVWSKLIGG